MTTRRRLPADLPARVAVAVPAAAVTVGLVALGGWPFALAVAVVGALAVLELARAVAAPPALRWTGALAAGVVVMAALAEDRALLLGLVTAALPALFLAAALPARRDGLAGAIAAMVLGMVWIGVGLAHGVLLRELPHGGGLVIAVLLGTFLGDTAAHLGGSAWGRRRLAPSISPNKTVEGALAGVAAATLSLWLFATLTQDWLGAGQALLLALAVALAAPLGDLFESLLKRDAGVKDMGRLFGAHGGALDRIDAVLFTAVAGYYVSLALL